MKGIHFGKQNRAVLQTEKELWVKTERVQNQGSGCGPEEERTHYWGGAEQGFSPHPVLRLSLLP